VKGQALPAWDPRPLKATGVTYASSPMGADHTAGLIVNPGAQLEDYAQLSQEAQLINAVCDSSGFFQFLQPSLDDIRAFIGALYGQEISREQIADLGWKCLEDEWEFNQRAGLSQADDDLPDCMREDPIGPMSLVWDVPQEIVQAAKKRMPAREELFAGKATG
jgi:aldehyde:ferredoxin oxidoreductase